MNAVYEQVRVILEESARGKPMPAGTGLREAGLDSVEVLEFFAELEHHFRFRFQPGDIDLAKLDALDEIAYLVERRLSQR
jgi:acyl carrier protein